MWEKKECRNDKKGLMLLGKGYRGQINRDTKEWFEEKFNLHDSCDCVLFLTPNNGKLSGKPRINIEKSILKPLNT